MNKLQARLLALLLVLLTSVCHAQSPDVLKQTRQLLDGLGLLALLDQAPLALEMSIEAEAQLRGASPEQVAAWRRELAPRLRARQLQQDLINYVAERYRADSFQRVEQLLQHPLARRVRYFDLAMVQRGAVRNLPALRAAMHGEPSPLRRELMQDVDDVTATSLLAATLQTGVTERVRRAAGAPASEEGLLLAEINERQRFLAPLLADYSLYAYRYLRDDELGAYRDLLRDPQLQALLDISRLGLTAALQGEIRPPNLPR